jgi:hypothetical protein
VEVVSSIKGGCARVAAQAWNVQIQAEQIALYAASLPAPDPPRSEVIADPRERAAAAAFWLTLDAINFGSGWFPTLAKRPGRSGYFTIAEGLRRRFDARGPWPATQLAEITAGELAFVLGQDPVHELMALFARSLRDLGANLLARYDGSFLGPIEEAGASSVALVERLSTWECFSDTSYYSGEPIPFLKRAQITAADLSRAGAARFEDLNRLTMFADNLVPHVLRLDGILSFRPDLVDRIDREELIDHGSPEEVEIRACAVHAVELIVAASPAPTSAAAIDQVLWQRGQGRPYKARPRHRSRCTAY